MPDQTPEIMSVAQVLAAGYASCTGLSIFLVAACRAVGIPARVAGALAWVVRHTCAGRVLRWGQCGVHWLSLRALGCWLCGDAWCLLLRPAAGTPSWVEDRRDAGDRFNNHCWTEVWTDDAWSFTGGVVVGVCD